MSELMNHKLQQRRWQLLTTVSSLALAAYSASVQLGRATEEDRPTVWIELGGQAEIAQGTNSPFQAPFMFANPTPDVYKGNSFFDNQKGTPFSVGAEGKLTFQPAGSDWIFSAGVRYGRSRTSGHAHKQTAGPTVNYYTYPYHAIFATNQLSLAAFFDSKLAYKQHHTILDFSAGKDIGIGILGHDGSSSVNGGLRLVEFGESSTVSIYARPQVVASYPGPKYNLPFPGFDQYTLTGHTDRSFRGLGPSLSWNASAGIVGNSQDGEVTLDWGINAALLFGRQKAETDHTTQAYHFGFVTLSSDTHDALYPTRVNHSVRSRSVTVPNLGGFAGLSVKYPNAKISLGYRADFFFGAVDAGIDTRRAKDLGFAGPFATVSIGLGG